MNDTHVLTIPKGAFEAQKSRADAIKYLMENGQCPYCFGIFTGTDAGGYLLTHVKQSEQKAKEHIDKHEMS